MSHRKRTMALEALLALLLCSCESSPRPPPPDAQVDTQHLGDTQSPVPDVKRPLQCPAKLTGADSCIKGYPGCKLATEVMGSFLCAAPCKTASDCPSTQGCDPGLGYCLQRCTDFATDCKGLTTESFICSATLGLCTLRSACKLIKPYSSKNAVCNQCAESQCCVEVNGCLGDPACDDAYVNCTLVCALSPAPDAGMGACLGQCAKDHPKGKAEYDAAIGCADSKCATECK